MFTLDTNAIIYYLKGEETAIRPLDLIFSRQPLLYISTITEIELFGFPELTLEETGRIESFLRAVTILSVDSRIARIAGSIRRQYQLKTLDTAIAATALATNSVLITRNIRDFRKIPNLKLLKI